VPSSPYKFRLGVGERITLRCDRVGPALRCRARAVIGSLQWTAEMDTSEAEIEQFLADIARVLSALSGTAELKPKKAGTFTVRVSVDPRGAIKTEYEATGSGGFKTGWEVKGSYLSDHQSYVKRLEGPQTQEGGGVEP
jgi:hypothetical protein